MRSPDFGSEVAQLIDLSGTPGNKGLFIHSSLDLALPCAYRIEWAAQVLDQRGCRWL